jgi:hypothetical protein
VVSHRLRIAEVPLEPVLMQKLDTTSYWIESQPLPRFAALDRDVTVDVAIVGGGITGITAVRVEASV